MAILCYDNKREIFIRSYGLETWLRTRGLSGWLNIATYGLAASARERIANEIRTHHAEAVKAHIEEGESEVSAYDMALAELGDPTKAAKDFKKSHLTESEAKWLRWLELTVAKPLFSFQTLWIDILSIGGIVILCSPLIVDFTYLLIGIMMLVAFTGCRLIPRALQARGFPRAPILGSVLLSHFITFVVMGFFCTVLLKRPG